MKKAMRLVFLAVELATLGAVAGDLIVEGDLTVTSNLVSQTICATNAAFNTLLVDGPVFFSGTVQADGSGITNMSGSSLALGSVGAAALAVGAVTSNALAAGSVSIDKAKVSDWNTWGDMRYLKATGNADLELSSPGRVAAGNLVSLSNISVNAWGASQHGCNDMGMQCIQGYAVGAMQRGYNSATQLIRDLAFGAAQYGENFGLQIIGEYAIGAEQHSDNYGNMTIETYAVGAVQRGVNWGEQTVSNDAYCAFQEGLNYGVQIIGYGAVGALQRGYNAGSQLIECEAYGASQIGLNSGVQTVRNDAIGSSQHGWNDGCQSIGAFAHGAAQRGYVAAAASATNNGVGSVQLFNLVTSQRALITGNASIGMGACMVTNDQSVVAGDGLSSHGKGTVTAFGFYGDGSGLTNLSAAGFAAGTIGSGAIASGAVVSAAIAAGAVGSPQLCNGAVTSNKIADSSVGIEKAVISEWNAWGDGRYLSVASLSDLQLNGAGRTAAGYAVSVTNIAEDAYGASQHGANEEGLQAIKGGAVGAEQRGYNMGIQIVEEFAFGATQYGQNAGGAQTIRQYSAGALQRGFNIGDQVIGGDAYGASQEGNNWGNQIIQDMSHGAVQRGYNGGVQIIGLAAYGVAQVGANDGVQVITNEAYGASQHGWNSGSQTIGIFAFGAEQRGFVSAGAAATNSGRGSVQLLSLTNGQLATLTGHASMGLGACQVTHNQALVAGDGLSSRGHGTVTAYGFFGDGAGLTNFDLSAYAGENLVWDSINKKLKTSPGVSSNDVLSVVATVPGLSDGDDDSRWTGTADGLDPVIARASLHLGSAATNEMSVFAPADLSRYASETVIYSNQQFHAAAQISQSAVTTTVLSAWQSLDTDASDDITSSGGVLDGDLDMNNHRLKNLPVPQTGGDAISKDYLRQVLSCLQPQGDLSMGAFTNGAPASFPLTF